MKMKGKGKGFGSAKGKSKSWGGGGGGGSWVYMPVAPAWGGWGGMPQIVVMDGGKGYGKGKGQGKGKGAPQDMRHSKNMDKLSKIDANRKVWVGGLEEGLSWGKLEKHFTDQDCKPSVTEIVSAAKGTACLAFNTAEEASTAIALVNGSELGGKEIEVDLWTQKDKREAADRRKKVIKSGLKKEKSGEHIKKDATMAAKVMARLKKVDDDHKVKVSGLNHKCDWKKLKEHFAISGCEVDIACIVKPGTAYVALKNADDASTAVSAIGGTELDGKTLTVDAWSSAFE